MNFSVQQEALSSALSLLSGAVERKTSIAVLTHVRFTAAGSTLTLQATDLEIAMTISLDAAVSVPGELCLPAKRLAGFVNCLPEGEVTFKAKDTWVNITSGRSKSKMPGLSTATWPEIPTAPQAEGASIKGVLLLRALRAVSFAISKEESRFTLNGALLNPLDGGGVDIVATDSHRLSLSHIESLNVPKTLLSLNCIQQLLRIVSDDDTVEFRISPDHIFVNTGRVALMSRKMTGNFPDYKRVMPKGYELEVDIPRVATQEAIRRCIQFADERSHAIILESTGDQLMISSKQSDVGEAEDPITMNKAVPIKTSLNASYLLDCLGASKDEGVKIRYKDQSSAIELLTSEMHCILMPMRL